MSLDELNKLLPAVDTTDTDDILLPTHTWLSYHTSIQGYNFVSNTQAKPLSTLGHTAKQAKYDYEVLQG